MSAPKEFRENLDSLLAFLAVEAPPADVDFPWFHPSYASFTDAQRVVLEHGHLFSQAMHGAVLLYNIALAELAERDPLAAEHRERFERWADELDTAAIRDWSLERLWQLTLGHGHTITPRTRAFVEGWVRMIVEAMTSPAKLVDNHAARALIRDRERRLKGGRSRFLNRNALDQWSGHSGLGRLEYRWSTVKVLLRDLHDGLGET